MLRNLDMLPFGIAEVVASNVGVAGLYIADVLCTLRTGSAMAKVQQVIAECLVPNWPAARSLPLLESRGELARVLGAGIHLCRPVDHRGRGLGSAGPHGAGLGGPRAVCCQPPPLADR